MANNTHSFFQKLVKQIQALLLITRISKKPLTLEEIEMMNLTQEQKDIQKEAQELIEHHAYEQFFTLVHYGYEPSKKQKIQISDLFVKSFKALAEGSYNNYNNIDFPYNQFLNYGYKMNYEEDHEVLFNATFEIYCEDVFKLRKTQVDFFATQLSKLPTEDIESALTKARPAFKNLISSLYQLNEEKAFRDSVLNKFTEIANQLVSGKYYSVKHSLLAVYRIYREKWLEDDAEVFLRQLKVINIALSKYVKSGTLQKEDVNVLIFEINKDLSKFDEKNFNKLVEKTKKAYKNTKAEIKMDAIKEILPQQAKTLPKEACAVIQTIEEKCAYLDKHKELLTVEQSFMLKNLVEARLPEIIEQYVNIPEEVRHTVEVDHKNAQELLLSSLDNIGSILDNLNLCLGEVYLHNLNVSEKYTKKLSIGQ